MKKVTSRMVALAAGVSQSTVSKVINNNPEVAPETARRVIEAAHSLNYPLIPRSGISTVAIIIPDYVFSGFIAIMLSALTRELLQRKTRIEIVFDTDIEMLNERCISGAIALSWDRTLNSRWGNLFLPPLVRINAPGSHADNCWSVSYDGYSSMENLIEYLWKLGHRKTGFFFFNSREHEELNQAQRLQGYVAALDRRGIPRSEHLCRFDCQDNSPEELAKQLQCWMDKGMTALIAANERCNVIIDRVIRLLDLKIPSDLSLVCWEMEQGSEYFTPPRTTLSLAPDKICRSALELLERCLDSSQSLPAHDILLPYQLIKRSSVGPVP